MMSACTKRVWLCLLLAMLTDARAITVDVKTVKLSADQRASLYRFLTDTLPALSFDWNSLEAHANSIAGKRQPLSATMSTVPVFAAAGLCRSEQHHFYLEAAAGKEKARWRANEDLTKRQAWIYQGGDCAVVSSPIRVSKSLTDAEFLFIQREEQALKSRAAQVIGGSDCARVRFCEVALQRINRERQENPSRAPRIITKLTFTPQQPGPACLYVMEVSFVGPLNDLVPLGASCPKP